MPRLYSSNKFDLILDKLPFQNTSLLDRFAILQKKNKKYLIANSAP